MSNWVITANIVQELLSFMVTSPAFRSSQPELSRRLWGLRYFGTSFTLVSTRGQLNTLEVSLHRLLLMLRMLLYICVYIYVWSA